MHLIIEKIHKWFCAKSPNEELLNNSANTLFAITGILAAVQIKPLWVELLSLFTNGNLFAASSILGIITVMFFNALSWFRSVYKTISGSEVFVPTRYKACISIFSVVLFPFIEKLLAGGTINEVMARDGKIK